MHLGPPERGHSQRAKVVIAILPPELLALLGLVFGCRVRRHGGVKATGNGVFTRPYDAGTVDLGTDISKL